MKRLYIVLIILSSGLLFLGSATQVTDKYYYAFDSKVPLFAKENTLLITYVDSSDKNELKELLKKEIPLGVKEQCGCWSFIIIYNHHPLQ
nr:hypothetical protein [uncultured Draconibacterium sp.]